MSQIHIFDAIKTEELERMVTCFNGQIKSFPIHKKLITDASDSKTIGVILSGEADLIKYDYDGYRNILEHLSAQDIFGSILLPASCEQEIEIVASAECRVLFFTYDQLIKRCSNACDCHSQLVSNMLQILSLKTRQLHTRIEVLSQRSIRSKLLTYFRQLAFRNHSNSFTLPFTLGAMADYLFIDRSAMLREMKKLREENLIQSKGREIHLRFPE